ncbi:hypothetical protein GARC_2550 [Paraglaciecola arctica BSs20135]|uniref:Uncharacterized protein n=1 Tax=Paraglaciecola arctica BSs20135 TaxID=493475 RepID=K6Y6C2_9ALTE|nr:hypothetical protein GARC_2550 [Paraglaciecola arctica BSs20135]
MLTVLENSILRACPHRQLMHIHLVVPAHRHSNSNVAEIGTETIY